MKLPIIQIGKPQFFSNKLYLFSLALFAIAAYFPLFLHLGQAPFVQWDESLFAARAYHMAQNGEYLYNFNQLHDGFNYASTKPPLITWVQALSFKIFGFNELALRLPIAFCCVLTLVAIVWFFHTKYSKGYVGILAGITLLTITRYTRNHMARTGDHDAALALFLLISAFTFYQYLKFNPDKSKWLWLTALFTLLATLTKGLMGFMFIPCFVIAAFYNKKLIATLKSPQTYLAAISVIALFIGQYLYREWMHPGFLEILWNDEMGGRFSGSSKIGHQHPFMYYFDRMYEYFGFAYFLLLFTPVVIVFFKNYSFHKLTVYLSIIWMGFMLIISKSGTKLPWYIGPILPITAILCALNCWLVWQQIKKLTSFKWLAGLSFIILLFYGPYTKIIETVYFPKITDKNNKVGVLLKQLKNKHPQVTNIVVADHEMNFSEIFYRNHFIDHYDYNIERSWDVVKSHVGERLVVTCKNGIYNKVKKRNYKMDVIEQFEECKAFYIAE